MIILGLHFGHDASVAVVRDGETLVCIERERQTRLKHAIGLTATDVMNALDSVGVPLAAVDFCAVTSTQKIECAFVNTADLSFDYDWSEQRWPLSPLAESVDRAFLTTHGQSTIEDLFYKDPGHPYLKRLTAEFLDDRSSLNGWPSLEAFSILPEWKTHRRLGALEEFEAADVFTDRMRLGMHLPITTTVTGRRIPGFLFSHHYAHAAYAYYTSPFDQAAVFTHDGSNPGFCYENGMYYFGDGVHLYPVAPHFIAIGHLYERVAMVLGLGREAGPGKMMGLAPYGKPIFFDERFVGNWVDGVELEDLYPDVAVQGWYEDKRNPGLGKWLRHCMSEAKRLNYDFSPLGDTDRILEPINVDLAASTQRLLEEVILGGVRAQGKILKRHGREVTNLCLSGGVALNCPANSRIFSETVYKNTFVPPAVHDGGLSIGAALAVSHNILSEKRFVHPSSSRMAYLGSPKSADRIDAAIAALSGDLMVDRPRDVCEDAAQNLHSDKIVGWFQGRSEVGPRALGHRSILARADLKANWARVNEIKKRELWRPFAPAVLQEYEREWFGGAPSPSPFMLFTAKVLGNRLGAVTHVDGSARIQSVMEDCGSFFRLLVAYHRVSGIPVILNTSFNGPGEPIVETPEDAIQFFRAQDLDVLYLGQYAIRKK